MQDMLVVFWCKWKMFLHTFRMFFLLIMTNWLMEVHGFLSQKKKKKNLCNKHYSNFYPKIVTWFKKKKILKFKKKLHNFVCNKHFPRQLIKKNIFQDIPWLTPSISRPTLGEGRQDLIHYSKGLVLRSNNMFPLFPFCNQESPSPFVIYSLQIYNISSPITEILYLPLQTCISLVIFPPFTNFVI